MDFGLDLCILIALQTAFAGWNPRRLLCGQLLLGFATLAALAVPDVSRIIRLPVLLLCAAVVTGEGRARRILAACAGMLALCAAAAGFHLLGGGLFAAAGVLGLGLLLRRSRNLCCRWNIDVELELDGAHAVFPALIDTGNRLRESVSREPVLIVEAGAVPEIAQRLQEMSPARMRTIPFGVLGSGGELRCFRPDGLRIRTPDSEPVNAPPCRVAIYHGRIPGRIRALAPPEFADIAAQAASYQGIWNRARRFFYGLFECKAIHLRAGGADSQGFGVLHRRQ